MDAGFKEFVLEKAFTKDGSLKPEVLAEAKKREPRGQFIERQMPLWGDQYIQTTGLPLKQDYHADMIAILQAADKLNPRE